MCMGNTFYPLPNTKSQLQDQDQSPYPLPNTNTKSQLQDQDQSPNTNTNANANANANANVRYGGHQCSRYERYHHGNLHQRSVEHWLSFYVATNAMLIPREIEPRLREGEGRV